jgi:electron transfer flavoprotein beta subunit
MVEPEKDEAVPLVIACLAPADLRPEVDPLTGAVWADQRRADLTPSDAAALEHALLAGEAWGGRVVAVAAGPRHVEAVLRQAMAAGAAGLRVPWGTNAPEPGPLEGTDLAGDPDSLAAVLAAAICVLGTPALVMCGDRSALHGTGAVPALLAGHLGASQALGLVSLRVDGAALVAERRLDGGWRERLLVRTPAVCSVEAAGVRLRRASLADALAAQTTAVPVAPVRVAHPAPAMHVGPPCLYRPRTQLVPPPTGPARERVLALTGAGALSSHEPPRIVGPIDPEGGAEELLDFLGRHGYLGRAEV